MLIPKQVTETNEAEIRKAGDAEVSVYITPLRGNIYSLNEMFDVTEIFFIYITPSRGNIYVNANYALLAFADGGY